jgi:hypothetical protein
MFEYRICCTQEYIASLELSLQSNWLNQYEMCCRSTLSLPHAFALIHPWHYSQDSTQLRVNGVRGSRSFPKEVGMTSLLCASELIWGYKCSRSLGKEVQADHLFPYSLGGQTVASNKVYLCSLHNQMKSNDIHIFPWENGEPVWLSNCLEMIARIKRLT